MRTEPERSLPRGEVQKTLTHEKVTEWISSRYLTTGGLMTMRGLDPEAHPKSRKARFLTCTYEKLHPW